MQSVGCELQTSHSIGPSLCLPTLLVCVQLQKCFIKHAGILIHSWSLASDVVVIGRHNKQTRPQFADSLIGSLQEQPGHLLHQWNAYTRAYM